MIGRCILAKFRDRENDMFMVSAAELRGDYFLL